MLSPIRLRWHCGLVTIWSPALAVAAADEQVKELTVDLVPVGFQKSACAADLGDRYGPASRE